MCLVNDIIMIIKIVAHQWYQNIIILIAYNDNILISDIL